MKRIASLLLAACLLAAPQLTGKAQAEGFALSDFGARGTALAGGMVARADDPSAVAWNPAGITQLPGTQIMVGMTAIQPSGTVDTVDRFGIGRSTDVDKHTWANPHAYLTHQFTSGNQGFYKQGVELVCRIEIIGQVDHDSKAIRAEYLY